jgi:hydrazine synthase alpha subunit-like protein
MRGRRSRAPADLSGTLEALSIALFLLSGSLLMLSGCSRPVPRDILLIAQSPRLTTADPARDILDVRCPRGSRVVIATTGLRPKTVRVLSAGLAAAGEPLISYDARRIVFAGKIAPDGDWQIYEAQHNGGRVRALTAVPGGAMDPALLSDGSLVFVSPVPRLGVPNPPTAPSALYVQPRGGTPHRLTYGTSPVRDPTVLSDGRILFVSSQPSAANNVSAGLALYTINNDGTEISAFAAQHDEPRSIQRPRQLEDGRIVFVAANAASLEVSTAETVLSARPFRSRAPLFPSSKGRISAVQPAGNGDLLVCAEPKAGVSKSSCAVFRVGSAAMVMEALVYDDQDWNSTEAVQVSAFRRPMGRLSNVDLSHNTGQILCLDVNDSCSGASDDQHAPRATRIRVFTQSPLAHQCVLGEVEVQADGSFMAEVPADMPLGFEALDERGRVLHREPALIWVRPGENRSCIGCHEPHNHSPRNFRPLAVHAPVPRLCGEPTKLAQNGH